MAIVDEQQLHKTPGLWNVLETVTAA